LIAPFAFSAALMVAPLLVPGAIIGASLLLLPGRDGTAKHATRAA
jgi:hypothetical protein